MTRSEFDDIRAHIAAESAHAGDLLQIARELLDDLEVVRMREATLRSYYLGLLTAARATMAADGAGDPMPLTFLAHELGKHGQLPSGEEVQRILSDAKTAQSLIPRLDDSPPRRVPSGSVARRCAGVSRSLPR
jgi:hypothetical protein